MCDGAILSTPRSGGAGGAEIGVALLRADGWAFRFRDCARLHQRIEIRQRLVVGDVLLRLLCEDQRQVQAGRFRHR
jgi:hypothetical protein